MNYQFSQRVSDVLTYSKEEANRLGNGIIGPEHLLLGILRDGTGKAVEALTKLDANLNQIKECLEEQLTDTGNHNLSADGEMILSPAAARILKMCMLEARLLKSELADTEHLLLAILKDGNNGAATILNDHFITYQAVYELLTMKSANPNAGMGFTEDDDDEEEMSSPRSSSEGSRGMGEGPSATKDRHAEAHQRHARARQLRHRHHPCRRRGQAGPRRGPRTRD